MDARPHRSRTIVAVAGEARHVDEGDDQFPAYGPIAAILGCVLVVRVTPAVVTVFSDAGLDPSRSFVRFGLATASWFVLVVIVDRAVEALLKLVPVDAVGFDLVGTFVVVVFFLADGGAAHSLDRLVIDGSRVSVSG